MTHQRVARRYALALMESALEAKILEAVSKDLRMMRDLMRSSAEFAAFLRSPVVKREKKGEIFVTLFSGKVQAMTSGFLKLLAEKGREELLPGIIGSFFLLRDEREGVMTVDVRSATELTPSQADQLTRRFEAITKKRIRLSQRVDASLKGGFVARVGDTVFDGSVSRQLEILRKRITEGASLS